MSGRNESLDYHAFLSYNGADKASVEKDMGGGFFNTAKPTFRAHRDKLI